MAATVTAGRPPPAPDTVETPLPSIHKLESPTIFQHPIWTRVFRVRQLLTPLKAPSGEQTSTAGSGPAENPNDEAIRATQQTETHHRPTSRPATSQADRDSFLKHSPTVLEDGYSNLHRKDPDFGNVRLNERAGYGSIQHNGVQKGLQTKSSNPQTTELSRPACTTAAVPTSPNQLPAAGPNSSKPLELDGISAPFGKSVGIAFEKRSTEKLGHNCFMDKRAAIPEEIAQRWNEEVKPKLDQDLQKLIGGISRADHILSTTQLYMAGIKQGATLLANPTIVISCGTKECKRKVAKHLAKLKLHYLDDFGQSIKVRYQRSPSYWAALPTGETSSGKSALLQWNILALFIERGVGSTNCGLKLRFYVEHDGSRRHCYATLGGTLRIGETIYGMTTAHTFLVDSNCDGTVSDLGDLDHTSFGSDSDSNPEASEPSYYSQASLYDNTEFEPLSLFSDAAYSFLGQVARAGCTSTQEFSKSDWALFEIPKQLVLPNLKTSVELSSIIPEMMLPSGGVQILCAANTFCRGFLTNTKASFHTQNAVMDVREVLLDGPPFAGSSGSWIVRDNKICGYVVAITGSGLSCFMVPMERALREIEAIFGQKVELNCEVNEAARTDNRDIRDIQQAIKQSSTSQPTPSLSLRQLIFHAIRLARQLGRQPDKEEQVYRIPKWSSSGQSPFRRQPYLPSSTMGPHTEKATPLRGPEDPYAVDWDGADYTGKAANWPVRDTQKQVSVREKLKQILVSLALTFINGLVSTMVAPGVPFILRHFHSTCETVGGFVVSIYVLGFVVGPLLSRPMSKLYGRLIIYHASGALFIVFNVACAVAPSLVSLLAFRFLASCAGACSFELGSASVKDMFKVERRNRWNLVFVIDFCLGFVIGPVIGGYLAQANGWQRGFWVVSIAVSRILLHLHIQS